MPVTVVLVGPQYPGNVGHVARSMLNFGVERLVLVHPPIDPLADEARQRAVHAGRVLENARVVGSLADVLDDFDLLAAFAARVSTRDRSHLRTPVALPEFAPQLAALAKDAEVALVFGPEDDGLSNEDVERCDAVVTIPTSDMYRSMNLSHAVTVALYALATATPAALEGRPASTREKELLFARVAEIMQQMHYPEHRVRVTTQAFRRVVGRAVLTRWEYHRIMGVFTRAHKFLERTPPFWVREAAEDDEGPEDAAEDPGAPPDR